MQGGVGDCTNEIARALTALGVDVNVVTSAQAATNNASFVVRSIVKKWNWSSLRTISNTIQGFSPDIVHIQFQTAAFTMHPAIYFLPRFISMWGRPRARLIVTFHDLRVPYLFPKAGPLRTWITRELARSCDTAIATNEEDYSLLETWGLRQFALIPIGSNITTTPPPNYQRPAWRAHLGVTESETLLCYFGFLNESKGGETLVRALAQLPSAKLLMIGGQTGASDPTNAAYLTRVKGLIGELGLSSRVMWTDHTPPEIVTANFFASDMCVLPYRDGASFRRGTLMAALAHGMPIVTTLGATHIQRARLPSLIDGEIACSFHLTIHAPLPTLYSVQSLFRNCATK
jgi:glycosyltransferase involved in cell wall biosynthesis